MENCKELFKKNKRTIIILAIIILIGIFLRTYNFHDWLRFGHDQARDQWIISKALEGKNLPLLGPNAGTTAYQLGPIYYYFSYASELLFGNKPDAMAYPSLFFSILSIPLLFFFLREFFTKNLSLALTSIASISYFLVINSRFSSNPNLITFFILLYLYSLLKIFSNSEEKYKYIWGVLAGIGIGVGIQLHTTLLTAIPLTTFFAFVYVIFKSKSFKIWKMLLTIILIVLFVNTSQIYHEIKSSGGNTKLFFKGLEKTSGEKNYGKNIFLISACQIEANTYMISSIGDDIRCRDVFHQGGKLYYFGSIVMIFFSVIGYFLLGKKLWQEKDQKKKNFLGIILLFNTISFVLLVPIAKIIYVGYFINLFFVPFILLGIFFEEFQKKYKTIGKFLALAILTSLAKNFTKAESYYKGFENNSENSTLSQVESMRDYIFSNLKDGDKIYFSGQGELKSRFFYPLEYFARKSKRKIERVDLEPSNTAKLDPKANIFYIGENNSIEKIEGYEIISKKDFSRQTIFILKNQF